jgi:hypothetical protein
MKQLMVEVIAYAPTQYFHCQHCEVVWNQADVEGVRKFHADAVETSMPPEMMREYRQLSDWVLKAVERYGGKVVFKIIDAASVEGMLKSVRYGVRKYPAFIVNGKDKQTGADFKAAEQVIDKNLAVQPA